MTTSDDDRAPMPASAPTYEVRWQGVTVGAHPTREEAISSAQRVIQAWGDRANEHAPTYAVVERRVVETMVWRGGA